MQPQGTSTWTLELSQYGMSRTSSQKPRSSASAPASKSKGKSPPRFRLRSLSPDRWYYDPATGAYIQEPGL